MRDRLAALYRAYSCRSGITPNQSAVLAEAACVLGSRGIPGHAVSATIEALEAAFENQSRSPAIPPRPIFSGFILEFSRP
ncbi:hypothetical protein ABIE88_003415 [Bradyrhizobium diazoefficiens]|uniref:hypothetical protein n=1 Tax=Bradyrhizobium diazoefficiens TaxID=1355477 RepID=UPI003517D3DA